MIDALAIMVGITLVVAAFADLINTLVTTSTVKSRWWLSRVVARLLLRAARIVAHRRYRPAQRQTG